GPAGPHDPLLSGRSAQHRGPRASLGARRGGERASAAASLRQAIASVDRRIGVVSIRPLGDMLLEETARPAFRTAVLSAIAGLSVALAAIGLAGVVAYSVSRRTAEMGVRMALGAGPHDIAGMVLREALRLGGAGGAVGLAAAAAVKQVFAGFVFGVSPGDPASFALAAIFLAVVIVGASAGPAWCASRVDPVVALRAE